MRIVPLLIAAALAGCAHAPKVSEYQPKALLAQACEPGKAVRGIRGSVWLKATSKEASGQFPALVKADIPADLRMEVTNLVGGLEAVIAIQGKQYSIDVPNKKEQSQRGSFSWAGIPLEWATELFLGRIPCPPAEALGDVTFSRTAEGDLIATVPGSVSRDPQKFVYRFRVTGGKPWAESLHWERNSAPTVKVDFKFEDPEDSTRSPRRWEARSDQGEVKVRWKDREVLR